MFVKILDRFRQMGLTRDIDLLNSIQSSLRIRPLKAIVFSGVLFQLFLLLLQYSVFGHNMLCNKHRGWILLFVVVVVAVLAITCCATNKHSGWKAASKQRTGEGSWPEAHNAALSLPPCPCFSRTVVSSGTRRGLGLPKEVLGGLWWG